MTILATDQDAAHRPLVADLEREVAAYLLGRRQVGDVRAMALAGVDHQHAGGARGLQQIDVRLDRAAQQPDIVTQRIAEAARLQKVALHVDDHQRTMLRRKGEWIRLCRNSDHQSPD